MKIDMTHLYQVVIFLTKRSVKVIVVISYVRIIVLQYGAYLINNPFIKGMFSS